VRLDSLTDNVAQLAICSSDIKLHGQHDILNTNEPVLMNNATSVCEIMSDIKQSTSGSRGQRSRSHEAQVRLGDVSERAIIVDLVSVVVDVCGPVG